jgi:hypothetical protein
MGRLLNNEVVDYIHLINHLGELGGFCGGGTAHMRVRACARVELFIHKNPPNSPKLPFPIK